MMQLRKSTAETQLGTDRAGAMNIRSADSVMEYLDPLDADLPSDLALTLSHRQLYRLVLIAAETGARFEREGVNVDPVSWLFAPRVLFNGRQGIVACREREPFVSAIILHSLSIGFDADPEVIDTLLADDGAGHVCEMAGSDPQFGPLTATADVGIVAFT